MESREPWAASAPALEGLQTNPSLHHWSSFFPKVPSDSFFYLPSIEDLLCAGHYSKDLAHNCEQKR